jgi:transposase-like protein
MTQHFLLSAKARTLSVGRVFQMNEKQAFKVFKKVRWGDSKEIPCPRCDVIHEPYFITSRNQWRCKECSHTFSVTSGTIFASHKLPLMIYLAAIAIFTNAVKGLSALQLSRDLDVQYKTAFVLAHKIRESLMEQRDMEQLSGEIHMDGTYVNAHVRPENRKEDRIDRRLAENQNPDKRCVLVMSEKGDVPAGGSVKTLTFVLRSENQTDVNNLATSFVMPGSTICADESNAYDVLHARFDTRRVNHCIEYRSPVGITNNLAESFFSRFRRMQLGQMHKFGNLYLANYANEAAYREDTRHQDNGSIFDDICKKCMKTLTSHDWCGYWQGNKRRTEWLAV